MIRLATPADLSQAADIYEEILDREAQGPVYTNCSGANTPPSTPPARPWRPAPSTWARRTASSGAW